MERSCLPANPYFLIWLTPQQPKYQWSRFNSQDPVKAFSEAKMPRETWGRRARPSEHLRPQFLTPAELTLLFGLEAFELKCALARFPGFLVWTGQEWETPFLRYFRTLSSCVVPKGGSSERGKGSLESHHLQAIRPPLCPHHVSLENLFPSPTWAPFSLFFLY